MLRESLLDVGFLAVHRDFFHGMHVRSLGDSTRDHNVPAQINITTLT